MPAPRNPVTVALEDTFNQWRQETNAVIDILNYYLNSSNGLLEIDSATLTNVNVDLGTVQNVTITDSTLEPSISGFLAINNAEINDSNIDGSTLSNSTVINSTVANVTGSGYWSIGEATFNIATGNNSDRIARGTGGNAELFWDREDLELRIFDGSVIGGRVAAIDGLSRDAAIALIIALG